MGTVLDRPAKHIAVSPIWPIWLMAGLSMFCPGTAHPALPPAAAGAAAQDTQSGSAPPKPAAAESVWALPTVRFGGVVSYNLRRDMSDEQNSSQQGLTTTLNASTSSFIWQPWFARVNGNLGFTMSQASSSSDQAVNIGKNRSQSVIVTGGGQLSVLEQSRFPFKAHFERNDNRVTTDLALPNAYASQRYGFTQSYARAGGNSMIGWDRNTQTSAVSGRYKQDALQLNLSQSLDKHRLQLLGNRSMNTHESTGETAVQNNLSLQHSYAPNPSISVENMANISRSGFHLRQGDNATRLLQLSNQAFWRPADQAMTVTGGARVFMLEADTTGFGGNSVAVGARIRNANANAGVNYDLSRFARINAGVNVNLAENNAVKSASSNQSAGASYQPASIELGGFRYGWSTSGNATNRTGADAGRQLTLQLGHQVSRSFKLESGSTVSMEGSQSLATVSGSATALNETESTRQLIHSGSLSWDLSQQSGAARLRLSASDSRTLGDRQESFQLVNFQASSNWPTGRYSSWSGNLTIQAVRQSANTNVGSMNPLNLQTNREPNRGFVASSSGSISYQNQRMFGVPRLRFVSDLRLNSQALLPLLGSAKDQETASWENRLDYSIGRTQLRVHALLARIGGQTSGFYAATGVTSVENVQKINKSIMFSLTRSF